MHTEGRRWRPLEDTAIANHILREGSRNWGGLRRSQDYYLEGALLWLEAGQSYKFVAAASDSLGLAFREDGTTSDVVPGMAADKAGLAPGMKVEGVNGRKFSRERLQDAIADSVTKRQVEFLVLDGDTYRTFVVQYADGLKYRELTRDPNKPDLLMNILKPAAGAP